MKQLKLQEANRCYMSEDEVKKILENIEIIKDKNTTILKLASEVIRLQSAIKNITNKYPLEGGW